MVDILIDCDGVCADFTKALQEAAKLLGLSYHAPGSTELFEQWPDGAAADVSALLDEPGTAMYLPVISGARQGIDKLRALGLRPVIVTKPWTSSTTWAFERIKWVMYRLGIPAEDIILCDNKWRIAGLTLCEDSPKNAEAWARVHKRKAILFDQPWNRKYKQPSDVIRVYSWDHALREIERLLPSTKEEINPFDTVPI